MTVFDPQFALAILPALLDAARITIVATILAFCIAAVLGLVIAIGRRSRLRAIRLALSGLVEFVRSTPLLVQLYFLFYVAPHIGFSLSPIATGVIGIGIHYSCFTAEAYRAGLESVPRGQWEAALALNYSRLQMFRRIILPQAVPPIVPIMANYMVAMLKDTPIMAAITVVELMQTAQIIASEKFLYVEPMTLVGIMFLVLSVAASIGIRALERRIRS